MKLGHESLKGLDRDRVISVVEPILASHGVDAVELAWRSAATGGMLLVLTVETPDSSEPAAGVTLDLCAEISRDLSAALDVADCMPGRYRLEVGSPGIDRALYGVRDYARFSGRTAKVKLVQPVEGQRVFHGCLRGVAEDGRIVLEGEGKEHRFLPDQVESGRLTFDGESTRNALGRRKHGQGPQGKRTGRAAPRVR